MALHRNRRLGISTLLLLIFFLLSGTLMANEQIKNVSKINNTGLLALEKTNNKQSNISVSGMIKVDFIHDLGAASGDRINYLTIPTDDSIAHGQSRIHARESRLGVKYLQDFMGKNLTAYAELDFFGGGTNSPSGSEKISNSVNLRLRHAYISYDHWLLGQTWSNYVDVKSFPETLDFSNETGQSFIRQGLLRYQHEVDKFLLSYSFENPETDVYILEDMFKEGAEFQTIDPLVDFTARAKYQSSWGHVSFQVVARKQKVYVDSNSVSDTSFGLGTSGKLRLTPQDILKFHYSQGDGIGRYIQEVAGSSGLVIQSSADTQNETASLTLLKAKGGYLSYQHSFDKTLRLNISSGFIDIDYSSFKEHALLADRTQKLTSFHGNVIWSIFPNFDIGIEHSIVKLTTVSGDHGNLKRLQLSTKFRF